MTTAMENFDCILKKNGQIMLILGDSTTSAGGDIVNIETAKGIKEIGQDIGWDLLDLIPISVTPENLTHAKNTITDNSILWFRKQ
jgi:hypothetical protein